MPRRFPFLEHYVLLGNYQQDPDRAELSSRCCRIVGHGGSQNGRNAGEANDARAAYQALVDDALAARNNLTQLETERNSLLRRLERAAAYWPGSAGR